jgi:hypothetical protein
MNPLNQPTQPTEAHRKLAKEVIGAYKFAIDGYAAQLIADSEARTVEAMQKHADIETERATHYRDQWQAERERVRVLREALEKYQHTVIAGGTNPARDALAAMKGTT